MCRTLLIIIIFLFIQPVRAQIIKQEVISSAGGYNIKGDISVSWTLGEIIVPTFSRNSLVLTHGFQQKLIVTAVQDLPDPDVNVTLFPNPAEEILTIKYDRPVEGEINLLLLDLQGRIVKTDIIGAASSEKQINLQDVLPGIYFLKLIKGKLIKIYRVVKL